jgi:hypothetical protein
MSDTESNTYTISVTATATHYEHKESTKKKNTLQKKAKTKEFPFTFDTEDRTNYFSFLLSLAKAHGIAKDDMVVSRRFTVKITEPPATA